MTKLRVVPLLLLWLPCVPASAQTPSVDKLLDAAQSTAVSVSAPTTPVEPKRSGSALRGAAQDALRKVDQRLAKPGKLDEPLVRSLVELHDLLKHDTSLSIVDRQQLRQTIRGQLSKALARLQMPVGPFALGQVLGAAPGGSPAANGSSAATSHAPQLIELIQDTIAPDSWDVRGGQGVVRYWSMSHALVVRQSSSVHDSLERLLDDLR